MGWNTIRHGYQLPPRSAPDRPGPAKGNVMKKHVENHMEHQWSLLEWTWSWRYHCWKLLELPSGYDMLWLTAIAMERSTMLWSSVNHLFRLGPWLNHGYVSHKWLNYGYVSHNQRVYSWTSTIIERIGMKSDLRPLKGIKPTESWNVMGILHRTFAKWFSNQNTDPLF